ncbi:MAG: cytidylate kinase family protein [bacterium]
MNFEINKRNIFKFVLPCIMTMVFTSIFAMSDGIIASNFVNEKALAAINLVFPTTSLFLAVGLMFGTGSSAICSKLIGEGKSQVARETMTSIILVATTVGVIFTLLIQLNIESILTFLGTSNETYQYAYDYLKILSCFSSILILQTIFQNIMVVKGKAFVYFKSMIISGIVKITLGCILLGYYNVGIKGLAITTAIGYLIPTLVSLTVMFKKEKGTLYIVKPVLDSKIILSACINGSSEMVTNLASAVTTFLFNAAMIKLVGDIGVSAITIILYIQFFLSSIFLGYSIGIAPIIGYNYGKKDVVKLKEIFNCSIKIIAFISLISFSVGLIFSNNLASLFSAKGTEAYELSSSGLRIFVFAFICSGFNIFTTGMFTAFSNGKISAGISIIRTLGLISVLLLVLPNIYGINGVWIAVPIAEFITMFISIYFINKYKEIYMYGSKKVNKVRKVNKKYNIITINRSFSSGGKEIGKRLSEVLGYNYYDEDIINDVINQKGISDDYLEKYSSVNFSQNYDFKFATSFKKYNENLSVDVYEKHSEVITKLSKKGNSIFIGCCSDYILKDQNILKIYIHNSDEEDMLNRLYEKNEKDKNKSKKEMKKQLNKINSNRKKYYKYFTGKDIDNLENYDLVIDISKLGIKNTVQLIKDYNSKI